MNRRINKVLGSIHHFLEDEAGAYGPAVAADVGGAALAAAEPGDGGALNPSDVSDKLDAFLQDLADVIVIQYDQTVEQAMKFLFSAADALAKEGVVPPVPEDEAGAEEISLWLGRAKTSDFASQVLARAREMLAK